MEGGIFHPKNVKPICISDIDYGTIPDLIEEEDMSLRIVPRRDTNGLNHFEEISKLIGTEDNSTYIHADYNSDLSKSDIIGVDASNYDSVASVIGEHDFAEFANEAYQNPEGYAIRVNPRTGEKEMFIAGTRTAQDWFSNVAESRPILGNTFSKIEFGNLADSVQRGWNHHATPWREAAQKKYSDIAHQEGIDVVYGHSRGGAIVADMEVPPHVQKVGLDAAMVIADNKGMYNYYQAGDGVRGWAWLKSRFDAMIGLSGQHNVHVEGSHPFHQVWNG
jgi:hypothetical protein